MHIAISCLYAKPAAFPGWFRKIVLKHSISFRRRRRVLTVPLESVHEIASNNPGPAEILQKKPSGRNGSLRHKSVANSRTGSGQTFLLGGALT